MGAWNRPVRKGQPSTNTRQHQNCSTTQRNKRSTTTIPTTQSRHNPALCWCTWAHSSVSQSKYSIFKNASPTTSTQHKCRFNRPTTNGHRPDVQRKRKAQGQRKELQRAKQRKDTMAQQRKRTHSIQQQWIWQRQSTNTNWLRQCFQRIRIHTSQRKDKKVKDPLHGKETKEKAKEHATDAGRWVKGLPCTSVQRSRSNRRAKHGPTTTLLLRSSIINNNMIIWPKLPTMEWTRSMAVWATMVSRAAGTRVHTTTSTNLATGTGSFVSEGWRTVCGVSYTHRPQHGLNSSNYGWQWGGSTCLFAKLWCRRPTTETYTRGDTTTALSYRWATQDPWVQMDQVLQQTRETNGDSLLRVWRDTTPNRQRYKVAGTRL